MNISRDYDELVTEIIDIEDNEVVSEHKSENEGVQIFNSINKRVVVLGEELQYEVKILNKSEETIQRKLFFNKLPKSVVFIKNSVTLNGTPLIGENPLKGIPINGIEPKDVVTVGFKVRVNEYISKISNENTSVYLEDLDSSEVTDIGKILKVETAFGDAEVLHAHLSIVKNVNRAEVHVGDELEYSIDIYNDGSYTPGVLFLYEELADELEIVEDGITENGYVRSNVDLAKGMRLTVIPPGYQSTIRIKAIVKREPSESIITNASKVGYNFLLKPSNMYSDYVFSKSNNLSVKIKEKASLVVKENEVALMDTNITEVVTQVQALESMVKKLLELKRAEMTTGQIRKNMRSQSLLIKIKNNGGFNECVRIVVKNYDNNDVADVRVCRCIEPMKTTNIILYDIPNLYEVTFEGLAFEMEVWVGERLNGKNSIAKENKFIEGHLFGNKNLRPIK